MGLRWLLLRRDKGIAAAGIERGDVHLLRPMPRFPAEHLSNEMRDRGGAGLAGLAGVKPGQHRRGGAGLPIQEEQQAGVARWVVSQCKRPLMWCVMTISSREATRAVRPVGVSTTTGMRRCCALRLGGRRLALAHAAALRWRA